MKITDPEIVDAMEFIKSQHNGELPYKFGTFECAKMMAKYLTKQSLKFGVVRAKLEVCEHLDRNGYITPSGIIMYCENCKKLL